MKVLCRKTQYWNVTFKTNLNANYPKTINKTFSDSIHLLGFWSY